MSSNSSVREQQSDSERIQKILLEQEALFVQSLKPTSSDSAGGLDAAGGPSGDSGNETTPQGNYLATQGDTMIGPIAFFPRLVTIDTDSIDVSKNGGNFTGRIIINAETGITDTLSTIYGAAFAGQKLSLESIAGQTITIDNTDNIIPPNGTSFVLQSSVSEGKIVELQFDSITNKWRFVDGAIWKDIVDQISGAGGDPSTWSEFPATENVDIALNSLIGVQAIEMKDSGNNNRGTFSGDAAIGTQLSLPILNTFRIAEVLTTIADFDSSLIDFFEKLQMHNNEIAGLSRLRFNTTDRYIQNDNSIGAIDYITEDTNDTHSFWSGVNRIMRVKHTEIEMTEPLDMTGENVNAVGTLNLNAGGSLGTNGLVVDPTTGIFQIFHDLGLLADIKEEFGAKVLKMDSSARIDFNNSVSSAFAGSRTLPANPGGFVQVRVGGANVKIPFYF